MKRRDFLKKTLILSAAGLSLPGGKLYAAPYTGYTGRLFVTMQLEGGWDVSSSCDPKVNQSGAKCAKHWPHFFAVR